MKFSLRLLELDADLAQLSALETEPILWVSRWIESCCDVSRELLIVEVSQ